MMMVMVKVKVQADDAWLTWHILLLFDWLIEASRSPSSPTRKKWKFFESWSAGYSVTFTFYIGTEK